MAVVKAAAACRIAFVQVYRFLAQHMDTNTYTHNITYAHIQFIHTSIYTYVCISKCTRAHMLAIKAKLFAMRNTALVK